MNAGCQKRDTRIEACANCRCDFTATIKEHKPGSSDKRLQPAHPVKPATAKSPTANALSRTTSSLALALVLVGAAHGQSNDLKLLDDRDFRAHGVNLDDQPAGFWDRFERAFDQRVDEVYASRLNSLKLMSWHFDEPADEPRWYLDRIDRSTQSAMAKSVQYSLRDAAVELPLLGWLEIRQEALRDFLVDSVDAVEEEAVAPLDPSYQATERLWWQSLARRRVVRYGLRPFRTNPYAFVSLRVQDDDRLILLSHVRYYFEDLADHRFELAVSLPLAHGFTLDVGTAYQFGRHEDEQRIVLKLFKPLKNGGIVHVGLEVQNSPTCFAGISMPL
jgi:hypothetical protein